MKNLYKILFCLLFFNANSQNDLQNANWIFGRRAWVNFNNNSVFAELPIDHSLTFPFQTNEGCASVSDEDGNLLFYTDGERVFRLVGGQPELITDQLFGDTSSAQNVIIIPRPNYNGRYYIVTIAGFSTNTLPRGIFFSEIDVLNWTMVGTINQGISDGALSLNNHNGNTFNNTSEAITSCLASNGVDFWLIFHAKDNNYSRVLSYLVTENGIDQDPSGIFILPNDSTYSYCLKASPDMQRLALGQLSVNPLLGTFNNLTGQINFNLLPIGDSNIDQDSYSVEFSPNSQILYYCKLSNSTITNGIYAVNLSNNEEWVVNLNDTNRFSTIQRAINESLYVAFRGTNTLFEIMNPDEILNLQTNFLPIESLCLNGLPQWIWSGCLPTLTLLSMQDDVDGNTSTQERTQWIDASNRIFSTANTQAIYHAGEFVELNPGFEADFGAQFSAYIEGCSDDFEYRPATSKQSKDTIVASQFNQSLNNITIYPNPSSNTIEIKSSDKFKKVAIVSLEGRIVYDKENDKANSLQVDVSGFANGVYIVNISNENGKSVSQKFVKK